MENISFGSKNSASKFEDIKKEFEDFKRDDLNEVKANNICSNIWHLSDWVKSEYYPHLSKEEFRDSLLFSKCEKMKIMHDIANAHKHKLLTRPKAQIKRTQKHSGAFDSTFDFSFDVSSLQIELENGDIHILDCVIEEIISFWEFFFEENIPK